MLARCFAAAVGHFRAACARAWMIVGALQRVLVLPGLGAASEQEVPDSVVEPTSGCASRASPAGSCQPTLPPALVRDHDGSNPGQRGTHPTDLGQKRALQTQGKKR